VNVSGRVVLKGGTAPAGQGIRTILQLRPDVLVSAARGNVSGQLPPEGEFTLSGAPAGRYHISVTGGPPGFYLADIRQGARSLYETAEIDLDAKTPDPIEIIFSTGGGTIRGSAPLGASILMLPTGTLRANRSLQKRLGVNATGQFGATDIAPGDYRLFAFETGTMTASEEESPEFLYRYETRAKLITVRAGVALTEIKLDVLR